MQYDLARSYQYIIASPFLEFRKKSIDPAMHVILEQQL